MLMSQEEAVASGKANAAIEMRWNDLMDYNMPQDLHRVRSRHARCVFPATVLISICILQEIEAQKTACAAIVASKNKLIGEFQLELRAKDEEYVRSLQKQRDEIEDLIGRMTDQFNELRSAYEEELEHIEDSFLTVRVCFRSALWTANQAVSFGFRNVKSC
jgi:dynein regulatry complex protein 1